MANDSVFHVYSPTWDIVKPPEPKAYDPAPPGYQGIPVDPEGEKKPGSNPDEPNPEKVAAQNEIAKNLLAQKNRKRKHGPRMELPFDPTMEEASAWTLVGFAPNFDGKWIVREVIFTFTGKGGSRMEIDLFQPSSPNITTPKAGITTVEKKRALVNNTKVGGEPNPVPLNFGFGGQNQSWLPAAENVAMASRK